MQIVSFRDNLHEMSKPFLGKSYEKNHHLSSAEFTQRVVKVIIVFSEGGCRSVLIDESLASCIIG